MAKFYFKVGKHARDLAGSFLATNQNYYLEVLELFAGLRTPDRSGERVCWMSFYPGDERLPAIAAAYRVSLAALSTAHMGHITMEEINAKWVADIAEVRSTYPASCDFVIGMVVDRISWMLGDLQSEGHPEDYI